MELPSTKALLTFAGRFVLIVVLLLPVWFAVTPVYNGLLAFGTNVVLSAVEHPRVHTLSAWNNNILIARADPEPEKRGKLQGFTGYLTHFNLILMTALVLSQRQVDWKRRARILVFALGILYVSHVLYLLLGVKFFQHSGAEAIHDAAGSFFTWGLNFYLSIASQLLPILIWMALYYWPTERPVGAETSHRQPSVHDARRQPKRTRLRRRIE